MLPKSLNYFYLGIVARLTRRATGPGDFSQRVAICSLLVALTVGVVDLRSQTPPAAAETLATGAVETNDSQKRTGESANPDRAAESLLSELRESVVARIDLRVTQANQVPLVIGKGDLLTIIDENDGTYVVCTSQGVRGVIDKSHTVRRQDSLALYDSLIAAQADQGRWYTLRGGAHWSRGELEQALADYDRGIELGYREREAYASRGLFLAATGEPRRAIADFSVVLAQDPRDSEMLQQRAVVYLASAQPEAAIADFVQLLSADPGNVALLHQLANARRAAGHLSAALADYDRLLELQPSDVTAWMGRGLIHFQKQDHRAAIDDFTQAIARAPDLAVAYNNRGYNHQRLKEWSAALADFSRANELDPKYGLAWQNKAWVLLLADDHALRDPAGALVAAQAACDLTAYGNVNDLIVLSAAYAATKDFERAVRWQEKVVDLLPDEARSGAEKQLQAYQRGAPFDAKLLQPIASPSPVGAAANSPDKESGSADRLP